MICIHFKFLTQNISLFHDNYKMLNSINSKQTHKTTSGPRDRQLMTLVNSHYFHFYLRTRCHHVMTFPWKTFPRQQMIR